MPWRGLGPRSEWRGLFHLLVSVETDLDYNLLLGSVSDATWNGPDAVEAPHVDIHPYFSKRSAPAGATFPGRGLENSFADWVLLEEVADAERWLVQENRRPKPLASRALLIVVLSHDLQRPDCLPLRGLSRSGDDVNPKAGLLELALPQGVAADAPKLRVPALAAPCGPVSRVGGARRISPASKTGPGAPDTAVL